MSKTIEIRVPDIGDFIDVPVVEVLVKAGDRVDAEQSLVTLESDKAVMEIPSPVEGVVSTVDVEEGDFVSEGWLVARLEAEEDVADSSESRALSQNLVQKLLHLEPIFFYLPKVHAQLKPSASLLQKVEYLSHQQLFFHPEESF